MDEEQTNPLRVAAADEHDARDDAREPSSPASPRASGAQCLAYEVAPPDEALPFDASWRARVDHARRNAFCYRAAAASLHCSIVAWTGLWDLLTYCGLARLWPHDASRNVFLVFVGLGAQLAVDTFHSNSLAPGELGATTYWTDPGLGRKWIRALLSFSGQVACTCGVYNLLDAAPASVGRDVAYAVVGLALTASVDAVFARAELRLAADGAPPSRRPGRWDASLAFGKAQRPRLLLGLAALGHFGQVMIWLGFDNLVNYWP